MVIGGAGYVGSHTVRKLVRSGHEVVVYDNLSRGHRPSVPEGIFVKGELSDREALQRVLVQYGIDAVMHFAAYALVGESVRLPELYYRNNFVGSLNLLEAMVNCDVKRLVFSSTCATAATEARASPRKPMVRI